MKKDLKIVFLGTPDFAVESLRILVENHWQVVAVITAVDKPQGRGKKLGESPVKTYAKSVGLPILQPPNLKSPEFLAQLHSYAADLQIVVAFRMLPEVVWNMPPLGTFNLHASLLPQYRGAAPINWAIINGEKETGITTFFLKHEIDTGAIIFQEKEEILVEDSVATLYERLMKKGALLVLKTVEAIAQGDYPQLPQLISGTLKSAPKIFKPDCEIDWSRTAEDVYNFIRGLSPFPGAWTTFGGKVYKILEAKPLPENKSYLKPGEIHTENKMIRVGTGSHPLEIKKLQAEGKRAMLTEDFLRGNTL